METGVKMGGLQLSIINNYTIETNLKSGPMYEGRS